MDRTYNTLFLIQSLDGKISTGDTDSLDVDLDFKRVHGVREGLPQYYDIEKTTDPFSLNSGKVMAKIGVNLSTTKPVKMECSFIVIDNKPHLTESGVRYLSQWVKTLYLVTTNKAHPAYGLKDSLSNIQILDYENKIDFADLFRQMKHKYLAERVTVQSGGQLNAELLRNGLIDEVSMVIAPCFVGGNDTQTSIGGESLHTEEDLKKIKPLVLNECRVLDNSYIHLRYQVTNITVIDPK
ncbi:TPA: deaminase [Candidatus Collierbacteria bacterium]|uniref:RibD domain protein n=1 Tax=Candidatus Collierbacteria bacterium GW2011_GWB2_44_22 TaxID=1618387 RepID=A0A0G1K6T4_9BACT|nr:MAG: RibD domain protein [Candidatus Collierbacteria bacterium GW2011_GWA2_44_13]KKT50716.1 MAG: RibD domain protein [Candidatus Collierbacteria bacterium GW2011_GWB1_44_197]KKT52037.1 MAG: RibD domain protein [Candidatus Collierbacteria bacterium GW2011_GWB2_44_22]KKT62631.1 MAG: RibD domain protein [Candidatus Collierbacteria bacterium GW2011_GWD1_44_27]KKT66674.1 MAG: RibD domain protein [Candidatus Collierbacteria bacterium GW2011_GWC2_44_30]KKT69366.1 MAG: RibD domain protein [Microgen